MKQKLVIIENNFCKFFAAKQLLETHFRLSVEILEADSDFELLDTISEIKPNLVLSHEKLGVLALCEEIAKRNLNRRNSVVYLIIKEDLPCVKEIALAKQASADRFAIAA